MDENLSTDLDSHHIEGFTLYGDELDSLPLISHITDNLWTGGCKDGVRLPNDFMHVISLYKWEEYSIGPDTHRAVYEMYDSSTLPDLPTLYSIAGYVLGCMKEGKTLVHCQAGLNRSGLVAGLALIFDGMDPETAIAYLRERRCDAVLCNPTFAKWLRAVRP